MRVPGQNSDLNTRFKIQETEKAGKVHGQEAPRGSSQSQDSVVKLS